MKAIFTCYSSVIVWLLFTISPSLLILQILVGHVLVWGDTKRYGSFSGTWNLVRETDERDTVM